MKLAIRIIKGRGDIQVERIVLEALENIQVGSYIVADTTYMNGDKVSKKPF